LEAQFLPTRDASRSRSNRFAISSTALSRGENAWKFSLIIL
jgi:hypothetical protein